MSNNPQVSIATQLQASDAFDATPRPYFPRRLRALPEPNMDVIQDAELLEIERPIVILGEPGMGKSEMIRHLSERAGASPISASRFMNSMNPGSFVNGKDPLFIDALDEAMARSAGDAVDKVLARLEGAGCPRFILSCRAREWQSRTESDLKEIYGASPLVVSIEELSRDEARTFWTMRGFASDADPVLNRMDEQNLSALYKNPLTLGLLGSVADSGRGLPATRADLFRHVCELSWSESDESRQNEPLAKLTQAEALSAAGAMMASSIFAGAEAISLAGAGVALNEDISIVELEGLPGGEKARVVISSKLFRSVGANRAAPIHRVVAEFLGAKWLADQAATSRARRRLIVQFQGAGAVPSSLRGLHAWLAFHSPPLAAAVISADPFGLLRYGESAALDVAQASALLESLEALARNDPHFRAQDWDARTALSLAQPALASRIESVIGDSTSNVHLRSLLLESVKGSPIVEGLSRELERIVLAADRYYSERRLAIEALLTLRGRTFWQGIIEKLLEERADDSARLARSLADDIQYDLSDELLARTLLAEIGPIDLPASKTRSRRPIRLLRFDQLAAALSPARAKAVLHWLFSTVASASLGNVEEHREFSKLTSLLLLRALRGGQISTRDAPALWRWLEAASKEDLYARKSEAPLVSEIRARDELRRAVQRYGIWRVNRRKRLWHVEYQLSRRAISIAADPRDVAFFLQEISEQPRISRRQRNDWQDLVDLSVRPGADNALIIDAALKFPSLSRRQRVHLSAKLRPRKHGWQIEQEVYAAQRAMELTTQRDENNRAYEANIEAIGRGDLQEVFEPAEVYLGRRAWDDGNFEKPLEARLPAFFNERLAKEFMAGFEAVLHRADLPSLADLAASYAEGKVFNYSYPLIAGLLAREKGGRGFGDLSHQVLRSGLLLCMDRRYLFGGDEDDLIALRSSIERVVAPSIDEKKQFLRTWIEPLLAARRPAESDIQFMAQLPGWSEAGCSLSRDWLSRFRDVPLATEMAIVALLASMRGGEEQIIDASRERDHGIFRDDEQALAWLAIDVVHRFDEVRAHLAGIGDENSEFIWELRDRVQSRRRGSVVDIAPAIAKWIVSEFRRPCPFTTLIDVSSGTKNGFDATDFLQALIARIADDTSDESVGLLRELAEAPTDTYTDEILHRLAEQRQKRAEEAFEPIAPHELGAILTSGPPANIDDLKALIVEELHEVQRKLLGDELDPVRDFWGDDGKPYDENRCRDRLAGIVDTRLSDMYSIKRMTEADMPKDKRADLAFSVGSTLQLPIEVKGQWHDKVWDAANSQLESQYLIDWRSEGRGIYCVFWFGKLAAATKRRLKAHPDGLPAPSSSAEMRSMLIDRIPLARRPFIDVIVLDLVTGRK